MSPNRKDTNFEINLLPVISLLAVCISFLLLTTVWIHIGTMDVHQAMGEATEQTDEKIPTLWVTLEEKGVIQLEIKDAPKDAQVGSLQTKLPAKDQKMHLEALSSYAKQLKEALPEIATAMILPDVDSSYEDIIAVMDEFKKNEYTQLGIAPL